MMIDHAMVGRGPLIGTERGSDSAAFAAIDPQAHVRRVDIGEHLTTRQFSRLVDRRVALIGLDPSAFGTYSLRRTKVAPVHKRTGNIRACQLHLGHTKLESTVRSLGIQVDDALILSEQTEI